ncbi:C39 family peptidase [Methylobacterium sp. J-030]|uniref:C39 family peptidase n=1 Tax=Methylobacterium sp. J-030 TaxID=2836627 RepID=UPI001FBBD748|nr:C39 family peptidase [Methylobacterium sp. J-030]MCJ2072583.1 C39 family peptidase [Methylobacterium sp. J-030]
MIVHFVNTRLLAKVRQILAALLVSIFVVQSKSSSAQTADTGKTTKGHLTKIDLNIGFIRQEKLLGVPTSAAIIMRYYGDEQSPRKLKKMSRGTAYVESEPFDDFSITFYRDIVKAVAELGYVWHEKAFPDDGFGFQKGLETIKRELEHGRPLMIDVSAPEGHTVVVSGFDETLQCIFVVDPNIAAPGRYTINYAHLQSIWNEHAFKRNFRSLVITAPLPYVS